MTPDDIKAVFPTLSAATTDWDRYDADKLSVLLRERELLRQRYESLILHPNARLAKDAFMTYVQIDAIVMDLQKRQEPPPINLDFDPEDSRS